MPPFSRKAEDKQGLACFSQNHIHNQMQWPTSWAVINSPWLHKTQARIPQNITIEKKGLAFCC